MTLEAASFVATIAAFAVAVLLGVPMLVLAIRADRREPRELEELRGELEELRDELQELRDEHLLQAYDRRTIVTPMAAGRPQKGKREPRSRGQSGRLPHGYRRSRSGGVEVDPKTAGEVVRVFGLIRDGASVRKTADVMTAETGRRWMATTVARIVAREEYKRAGEWRIIHPKHWRAAQDALARRKRAA